MRLYLKDVFILSLGFFTPPLGPTALGAGSVEAIGTGSGLTLGGGTLESGGDLGRIGDSVPTPEAGTPAPTRALGDDEFGRGGESTHSTGWDSGTSTAGARSGRALGGGDPRRGGGRDSVPAADRTRVSWVSPTFTPFVAFTRPCFFFFFGASSASSFPFLFRGAGRYGAFSPGRGGLETKALTRF